MLFNFLKFIALAGCMNMQAIAAPYTQDIGKIKTVFVSVGGDIAITLSGGFPNAVAGGQCTAARDYAGVTTAVDPAFKSTLLAAKAAQQTVRITVAGCVGSWFKILDVYVE